MRLRQLVLAASVLTSVACSGEEVTTEPVRVEVSARTAIQFLPPSATEWVFAASSDPYFESLGPIELEFLTRERLGSSIDEKRARYRQLYGESLGAFSSDERDGLSRILKTLVREVGDRFPAIFEGDWTIAKIGHDVANGQPHTLGNVIVFPHSLTRMAASAGAGPDDPVVAGVANFLIHERIHVLQRADPERYRELYASLWRFTPTTACDSNPWFAQNRVTNPDDLTTWVRASDGRDAAVLPVLKVPTDPGPRGPFVFEDIGFELSLEDDGSPDCDAVGAPESAWFYLQHRNEYLQSLPAVPSISSPAEVLAQTCGKYIASAAGLGSPPGNAESVILACDRLFGRKP